MKLSTLLAVVAVCYSALVSCEKELEYHVIRVEKMNETDEFFKYTLDVEKIDKTTWKVNSESDLFVDLDNEWHMWMQVFYNKEGKEDFGEMMLGTPKKGLCDFLKSPLYADRIYPHLMEASNFPGSEECPVKAKHFVIKDLVFSMENYSGMAKPGMWKIAMFISQDHGESHVTKMGMNIITLVEQKDES